MILVTYIPDTILRSLRLALVLALCSSCLLASAATSEDSLDVMKAMTTELERSVDALSKEETPLHFLSYEISERDQVALVTSFGALVGDSRSTDHLLDLELRVGDPALDNTHPVRNAGRQARRGPTRVQVPLSDEHALRSVLWLETDRRYKQSSEQYARVRASVSINVEEDSDADDFAKAEPSVFEEPRRDVDFDRATWIERLKRYGAAFSDVEQVYQANAVLAVTGTTRWYVNSEGSRIRTSRTAYQLSISASAKADDGMTLPRSTRFFAFDADGLPSDGEVMDAVEQVVVELKALLNAPVAEPYSGPAILTGRASGVFFHEILGHRVEGHRLRRSDDGQVFKDMIGESLLPASFSVVFDPSTKHAAGTDLAGYYQFDNEGVAGQRVPVIEDGVLRGFLMGRKPADGFPASNGHGRKQSGFAAVARQSNLFVEVTENHSDEELKAMLIDAIKKEGLEYGLLFDDIQGGFTLTGRTMPNSFNVLPTLVFRIYADGREEVVRGVDLIGTPLTTFSKIVAGGTDSGVFNGTCGAESGGVPVSAVSPPILVSQVEVQRKARSHDRLPLLPPPIGTTDPPRSFHGHAGGAR